MYRYDSSWKNFLDMCMLEIPKMLALDIPSESALEWRLRPGPQNHFVEAGEMAQWMKCCLARPELHALVVSTYNFHTRKVEMGSSLGLGG